MKQLRNHGNNNSLFFFVIAILTIFKCTTQWHLTSAKSRYCPIVTTISKTFSSSQTETLHSLSNCSPFSQPLVNSTLLPVFYKFDQARYPTQVESHSMFSFVTGLFHIAFKVQPCCSIYQNFIPFQLNNIPQFTYTTFVYPFIYGCTIGLLQFFGIVNNAAVNMDAQISKSLFSVLVVKNPGLVDHMLILCLIFLRNLHTVLHKFIFK